MSFYLRFLSTVVITFLLFASTIVIAESLTGSAASIQNISAVTAKPYLTLEEKYLADITINSPQELFDILTRADMLLESGQYSAEDSAPSHSRELSILLIYAE